MTEPQHVRPARSRRKTATTTTITVEDARQRLREFAAFIVQQNPALLAGAASDVPGTIAAVARLDHWLRRYAAVLRSRRAQ